MEKSGEMQYPGGTEATGPKRPMILTVICVVLFIGSMMAMQAVFNDDFHGLPRTVRYLYLASVILTVISVLGIFLMRRWGIVLYAATSVVGQAILISFGWWNPIQLLIALLICAVGFMYFRQMRW
jgi:hypothetical protein